MNGTAARPDRSARDSKSELGTYFRDIGGAQLLTADEERRLAEAIRGRGCAESRDRLIRANLRLVVAIAKRYANRRVPLSELVAEGNLGLVKAVEKFDPAYGARFSTYASWWIKQAILKAIARMTRVVHVPSYMAALVGHARTASHRLEASLGRPPSIDQVADAMHMPTRQVRGIWQAFGACEHADGRSTIGLESTVEDPSTAPDDEAAQHEEAAILRRHLGPIGSRNESVLRLRFGLDGSGTRTLKEISRHLGVSRERARQLVDSAIGELSCRLNEDASMNPSGNSVPDDRSAGTTRSRARSPRRAGEHDRV